MKETYIYTLRDPITNEIRYVGKTIQPLTKRLNGHITESVKSKSNYHKVKWIRKLIKNGHRPIIEILDIVPTSDWEFWEIYWISQLKTWNLNLTNSTNGGGSYFEYKHNSEARKKMRDSKIGTRLSESHKNQISESVKNTYKDRPNYNRRGGNVKKFLDRDLLYDLYITKNLSMPKVSEEMGVSEKKIWQSLKDYGIKKDKSVWRKQLSRGKKVVFQYDLSGNFIKEWASPIDVYNELGYNKSNIANCCRGISKTCMGFIWRYRDEFIDLNIPKN